MQTVFNDPIISRFFQSISHADRNSTLRELILLGINAVSNKIHLRSGDKENHSHHESSNNVDLVAEIETMKEKLRRLEALVQKGNINSVAIRNPTTITFQDPAMLQKELKVTHHGEREPEEKANITPKVTETCPPVTENQTYQRPRGVSRHHLDDSEVRRVLVNPYAVETPKEKKMKKKQKEKIFQHQEQIDQQALRNIKNTMTEQEEGGLMHSKRSMVSRRNQFHAQSKIKSLIEKDKQRFKQATTGFDFQKYEYSDDDEEQENYYETNQLTEQEPQSVQVADSSLNIHHNRKSVPESESDAISESSSFSKFSMSSQREVGKISQRRRN